MHFGRAAYLEEKPEVTERLVRALAKATRLMKDDTAVARDAFFAHAKAFGGTTDTKLAELQRNNMRPYFPTAMSMTGEGMKEARPFLQISDNLSNETLIDNWIARRVDGATAE